MTNYRARATLAAICLACLPACSQEQAPDLAAPSAPASSAPAPSAPASSSTAAAPVPSTITVAGHSVAVVSITHPTNELTAELHQRVLFLHGAAYSAQTWIDNTVMAHVAEHGINTIAIDLPGYGESERNDLPSSEFLAALFVTLELDPASTIIVSPSMSGGFSLPALRDPFFAQLAGYVPVAPVGIAAFLQTPDPVPVPALVIWGDSDGADPQASAARLAAGFATSTVLILPDAGHAAYQQQPDLFADALIQFAEGLSS